MISYVSHYIYTIIEENEITITPQEQQETLALIWREGRAVKRVRFINREPRSEYIYPERNHTEPKYRIRI